MRCASASREPGERHGAESPVPPSCCISRSFGMRHCRDTQRHDKSHSQHELAIRNSAWSPARSAEARADLLVSIYCCRRYSPHSSVATSAWPTMSVHSSLGAAGGPQLQLILDAPVSRARILTHRRAPPRLRAASLPVEFFDIHTRIDTVFLFFLQCAALDKSPVR